MSSRDDPRLESPNGREALTVSFDGDVARFTLWRWSDQTHGHPYPDAGWHPAVLSGFYASPEDALNAAAQEHAWVLAALTTAEANH